MKDIEAIKQQAKKGDAQSQVELAHAYLNGEGTVKNRGLYLKWLEQAGGQGHLESQLELVDFYSQKRNKYSNPQKALYWVREAQKLGVTFTEEQLLAVGDPVVCGRQIEEYLFGEDKARNFEKAKELILRVNPSQETLFDYAKRYYDLYHGNAKMLSNISYLFKISFNQNHDKLNEYAVELTKNKAKNNTKIAFSLFYEAYRLGNPYAASSYLYCLLNGKGCKRNMDLAAIIYFDCKQKKIDTGKAFVSLSNRGTVNKLPNSLAWKIACFKHKTEGMQSGITEAFEDACGIFMELLYGVWWIITNTPIVISLLIVLGILRLNFSWCMSMRQFIENLIPVAWIGYVILIVLITTFFFILKLLFKWWLSKQPKKPAEDLRKKWNEFGLSLPPFIVDNIETIGRADGCFGPSTSITVYTIRFVEKVPDETFKQRGLWVNPDYSLEKKHFWIKQLTEDTAEVIVNWEYVP